MAHSAQVNYDETGSTHSQHLSNLEGTSDGEMDNVHNLRNQNLADVVVLLVDDNDDESTCGLASDILATGSTAFATVHYECAIRPVYYSFAHEIGHLQGARHDDDPNTSPFAYGHGYVDPNDNWRTMMARGASCDWCTREDYWSNPNVDHPTTGSGHGNSC